MADRPILFRAPMVRAILDGRKTQTRRILNLPSKGEYVRPDMGGWEVSTTGGDGVTDSKGNAVPECPCVWNQTTGTVIVPNKQVGDRLWVRESWQLHSRATDVCTVAFMASVNHSGWSEAHELFPDALAGNMRPKPFQEGWRPSIHMPRWASRLTLTVTDVRVERLQEISEADALAEGIVPATEGFALTKNGECWGPTAKDSYRVLWDSINGEDAWEANPWVVAVSFNVENRNIDAK